MTKYSIIYRTCTNVQCFSGRPRMGGISKPELVFKSARSLARSIILADEDTKLYIVDDGSSPDHLKILDEIFNSFGIYYGLIKTDKPGNGASIGKCYKLGLSNEEDVIFFLEDDYLLDKKCISKMQDVYSRFKSNGKDVIVHPYDCPDRYTNGYSIANIQLIGDHYWRKIDKTTGTFMVSKEILTKYWQNYISFSNYGVLPGINEDNTINLVYDKELCISPVPTLAIHMQYSENIPAGIDWEEWWSK